MSELEKNNFLNDLFNKSAELPIVTIKNNVYTNHLLGISFEIPENWYIVSIQRFQQEGRKQKFNNQYENIKHELIELFDSPIIVLTKLDIDNDEYDGLVSPTINFSVDLKENEYEEMKLFEYANEIDIEEDECLLKKFKINKKGDVFEKDNSEFILFDSEYLFEHDELEEAVMVEFSVLNADYNDFFLDFSMTQCKLQGQDTEEEFNSFINSIKLNI
ncbi:MAG: hypothetical protein HRT69_14295 [Flavobacteriaceae bacterium]|nr:hypothetical protein [Flavobacteriaceae bacterium]